MVKVTIMDLQVGRPKIHPFSDQLCLSSSLSYVLALSFRIDCFSQDKILNGF